MDGKIVFALQTIYKISSGNSARFN